MKLITNPSSWTTSIAQGLSFKWPEEWSIALSPRFLTYSPSLDIQIDSGKYRIKTATKTDELVKAFRLRYDNFLAGIGIGENEQFDIDDLDHLCDHLVIVDREFDSIVGTYRIFTNETTDRFYSEAEFEMETFLDQDAKMIELGRACIDTHHRNGAVIDLLWKGIAEYIMRTNSRFLFGCTSVYVTDPSESLMLYNFMENKGWIDNSYGVTPKGKYQMNLQNLTVDSQIMENFDPKPFVPSLLRSYMSAGAKVFGHPALDADFECVDFLTVLDMERITKSFKRRYFK